MAFCILFRRVLFVFSWAKFQLWRTECTWWKQYLERVLQSLCHPPIPGSASPGMLWDQKESSDLREVDLMSGSSHPCGNYHRALILVGSKRGLFVSEEDQKSDGSEGSNTFLVPTLKPGRKSHLTRSWGDSILFISLNRKEIVCKRNVGKGRTSAERKNWCSSRAVQQGNEQSTVNSPLSLRTATFMDLNKVAHMLNDMHLWNTTNLQVYSPDL